MGCRTKASKTELLRVVAVEGAVIPDLRGRLPGRGAHLHPDPGCLALAEKRRAFPRAFRVPGPLETTAVQVLLETGDRQ